MNKGWMIMLLVFIAPMAAWSDTTIEKQCAAPLTGDVHVKNVSGSVEVQSWAKGEVKLEGRLGPQVKEVLFSHKAGRTEIEVVRKKRKSKKSYAHLQLWIPEGSRLRVQCVSASLSVEGVRGDLELTSVSGKIEAECSAENVRVETTSGAVEFKGNTADLRIETTSGRLEIEGQGENLRVESISGGIEIKGAYKEVKAENVSGKILLEGAAETVEAKNVSGSLSFGEVLRAAELDTTSGSIRLGMKALLKGRLETISGGIQAKGGLGERARFCATSQSGKILLSVPENTNASYRIQTFSGSISNDFGPSSERVSEHGPGRKLDFVAGDGSVQVDMNSLSGGIALKKQ
jgi:DUF4097 and DUF4098 domain-containing protein YvlB